MNKLLNLIKEKCPDGVDCVEIKSIAEVGTGSSDRKDAVEDGDYPFYVRSKEIFKINRYEYDETAIVIPGEGGIGEIFHFVQGKYALHQRAYRIHLLDDRIDAKFLYYYMFANFKAFIIKKAVSATVTSIRKPMIEEFEIPVPPIQVQQEIVRILDKFTELEAGLQAELDARKKQYEYYRDRFFEFENYIERKNILDVISIRARVGWQALTKKEYLTTGEYYLITGTDFREDGYIEFDSCVFVSEERYDMDDNIKVHVNDILMTKDGTLGKVAFMEQEPPKSATLNGGVYRLTVKADEVLPKYIYHYFTSYEFRCFIEKVKTGGTIKHLTQKWFETLEVPVPPIKKQEEIVRILDTFSALCNSRVLGLPAEIAARHKQYEYYRDKLLTFKRKEV